MKGNWQYALLAFALAVVAWYFVSGREKVETWVEMDIQLAGAPENMLITQGLPSVLRVRVRGPKGLMQRLDESVLIYSLDLTNLKPGENLIPVAQDEIALPSSFEVMELDPPRFKVVAEKVDRKMVRVEAVVQGELDPDYILLSELSEPAMVEIKGPVSLLEGISVAQTQVITLDTDKPGVIGEQVALDVPDAIDVTPQLVFVRLEYAEKTVEWSPTVAVELENMTGLEAEGWWPRKARLHLNVPVSLQRSDDAMESIRAWIVAAPGLAPGENELAIQVSLPEGSSLMSMEPETATVTLKETVPPLPEQEGVSP